MKIKSYIYIGIATTLLALASALCITLKSKSRIEKKYKNAMENVKSYSEQFSTATNKNRALKLTIEQLNYSNDSILQELNASRKELKVKDSKLQSMQYVASSFTKTDTIVLRDTIFKDTKMDIDTLVSDEWYSVKVGLKYPSTIAVSPEFRSVKNIIVSAKKETVDPPKKFFLFRWFQKKHYVLNIDVIEKNPYVQNQVNRYVEIVK